MNSRGQKKTRIGVVKSNKMDKSVSVEVTRRVKHPKYGKYIARSKTFHAHDDSNACNVGDKVRIVESRPLSKTKRWRVAEIVEKAPVV